VTRGLGAGADPERGRKAALEDVNRLKEIVLGRRHGVRHGRLWAAEPARARLPSIAQLAREAGALTVGVVTKPFRLRRQAAFASRRAGIAALSEHVDTLITIPNEKLMQLADDELTFVEAFRKADEVCSRP
jgi:cell division protein FtsZ